MRNLKKVLSLVLALVMTLSLANVAFAATTATTTETATAFTDAGTIQNADAVNLLNSLSVLVGYQDGSFGPTKTVTRAEAAAIICRILLGSDVAETLANATAQTNFTDMAGAEWASGYVQYCSTIGVINGYGDGTFGPSDTVTTYQLAKMLLCALGYGQNGEYTGTNWATNVAVQSMKLGVLSKGTVDKACTRDMTALYTYNTLFVDQVTYNNTKGTYDKQDGDSVALGKIIESVFSMKEISGVVTYVPADTASETAQAFNVSMTKNAVTSTVNIPASFADIGRTVSVWAQVDSKGVYTPVTAYTYTDTVTKTVTNGKLDVTTSTNANYVDVSQVSLIVTNGTAVSYDTTVPADVTAANTAIDNAIKAGVEIKLISNDTDSKPEVVQITEKTVDTVDAAGVTVTTGTTPTVTIDGVLAATNKTLVAGYSNLKAGDVVLYATMVDGVTYFEKAATVNGQLTAVTAATATDATSYTFGGAKYIVSDLTNAAYTALTFEKDATLYLDNFGNIVASKMVDTSAATELYFAIATYTKNELNSANELMTNTYVRAVADNGTVKDYLVNTVAYGGAAYVGDATAYGLFTIAPSTTVGAALTNAGGYVFTAVADAAVTTLAPTSGGVTNAVANLSTAKSVTTVNNGAYLTSATNYIFVTSAGAYGTQTADNAKVNATFTGSVAYTTTAASTYVVAHKTSNGTEAVAVYVLGTYAATASDTIFVKDATVTGSTALGNQYSVYVNGVKTTITSATALVASTAYTGYTIDTKGVYTFAGTATLVAVADYQALTHSYANLFTVGAHTDVDFTNATIVDLRAVSSDLAISSLTALKAATGLSVYTTVQTNSTGDYVTVVYIMA
jgi:hypothetical protein